MSLDQLIHQTRERFPQHRESEVEIVLLEKGGSDRQFYRIRFGLDHSLILVKYAPLKPENERYVAIAHFLNQIGVNAPATYYDDHEQGLIWMEDLGEVDLWQHRNAPWPTRRVLYESALEQVLTLHHVDPVLGNELGLQPGFEASLYRWEQNYCLENCLKLYFRCTPSEIESLREHSAFQELARRLASYPKVLIHRDFQSQNIIIRGAQAYLIDFQGLRLGLPHYDLASLLYDPYVTFLGEERNYLLQYYFERNDGRWTFSEFAKATVECAIQRLMQALGAYVVIGLVRKKKEYLRYIRPAIKTLIEVASLEEDFNFFAEFLNRLPDGPKPKISFA
jgi:N-acetylmuramate 1-kinase